MKNMKNKIGEKIHSRQTLITDSGSVEKVNIIDVVVSIICIALILLVTGLGVMAVITG